jgi:ArsR family transcriptional regulator, zinc-responsive transcriptional repressor
LATNKPKTQTSKPKTKTTSATKSAASPATKRTHSLTSLESLAEAAECLRALAHPHRLRMIQMLLRDRYPVGELAKACEIPSHMASEHLRLMQRCGFLESEKEGRMVYYQVAQPMLSHIMDCIEKRFDSA